MVKVVVAALVVMGVIVLVTAVVTWSGWRWLRRRNEVSASHATRPPLRWLASPVPSARLHRRLRDALTVMRSAVPLGKRGKPSTPLGELALDVERHAVALDHDLVVSARMHGPSGVALRRTIAGQVDDIERIAHRLAMAGATVSTGSGPAPTPEAIDRITEHLDALDAARAELARLEADAGLDLRL